MSNTSVKTVTIANTFVYFDTVLLFTCNETQVSYLQLSKLIYKGKQPSNVLPPFASLSLQLILQRFQCMLFKNTVLM